jgi:hypothetical protein
VTQLAFRCRLSSGLVQDMLVDMVRSWFSVCCFLVVITAVLA